MAACPSSSSSSSNPYTNDNESSCLTANTTSTTTTTFFVQADPSNFRAVVQRLTGVPQDPSTKKLPFTARLAGKAAAGEIMGMMKRSVFRLPERTQSGARKLEIKLGGGLQRSFGGEESPASPLEMLEEEERAIAEKGFYLHQSPLSTSRGSEPELLPLFPLHSPTHQHHSSSSSSST